MSDTEDTYLETLAYLSEVPHKRLVMGTWDAPLSKEQFLEVLAKEYWDRCDAGQNYRHVKSDILAHNGVTAKELHKMIVAYSSKYRR